MPVSVNNVNHAHPTQVAVLVQRPCERNPQDHCRLSTNPGWDALLLWELCHHCCTTCAVLERQRSLHGMDPCGVGLVSGKVRGVFHSGCMPWHLTDWPYAYPCALELAPAYTCTCEHALAACTHARHAYIVVTSKGELFTCDNVHCAGPRLGVMYTG